MLDTTPTTATSGSRSTTIISIGKRVDTSTSHQVCSDSTVRAFTIGGLRCIEPLWMLEEYGPKRSLHRGRVCVYDPAVTNTRAVHLIVWERANGERPAGHHVHHLNGNPRDNRLENLELISAEDHLEEHSTLYRHEDGTWWKRCTTEGCHIDAPAHDKHVWKWDGTNGQREGECRACQAKRHRIRRVHEKISDDQLSLF